MVDNMSDTQVSIRDLQRAAASVLKRVEAGETITVTRHGRAIARILPPDPVDEALHLAAEAGILDLDALDRAPTAAQLASEAPEPYADGELNASSALEELREAEGER